MIIKNSYKKRLLLFAFCFLSLLGSPNLAAQEVPVRDGLSIRQSKIWVRYKEASENILRIAEPIISTFQEVQAFFEKAEKVVNGVIKNMRIIQNIVDLNEEINDYYQLSIEALTEISNTGNMTTPNGDTYEVSFINGLKHMNIMLSLFKESIAGVELLVNVVDNEAALQLDDYNRVRLLLDIEQELRLIKQAMRDEIRRINKEIYRVTLLKKETETFQKLFATQ